MLLPIPFSFHLSMFPHAPTAANRRSMVSEEDASRRPALSLGHGALDRVKQCGRRSQEVPGGPRCEERDSPWVGVERSHGSLS